MGHPGGISGAIHPMKKFLHSEKGFGILEVIIGLALLGTGAYLVLTGLDFIGEKKNVADKNASVENMLAGLIESVRSNISMEKVDFNATEWLALSTPEGVKNSLKMCWVKDGLLPIDIYPDCPGRLGYVVTPMKTGSLELRGLYKVTIRLTHDELFPREFKQYDFIVKDP